MSIGKKLFVAFSLTVVATISVGALGLWHLAMVKDFSQGIYRENVVASEALNRANQDYLTMRILARDLAYADDTGGNLALRKQLYALDESFRQQMKAYRGATNADRNLGDQAQALDRLQSAYESYQKLLEDIFTLSDAGNPTQAQALVKGVGAERAAALTAEVQGLLEVNRQALEARVGASLDLVAQANTATVVLLLVASAFSLGAALFLTRSLARPLVVAADLARRLSEGDLAGRAPARLTKRTDEVGVLARSVDTLAQGLTDFAHSLNDTGKKIEALAHDLDRRATGASEAAFRIGGASESGHALAQGQAAAVTETTATVAQIAATIEKFDGLISTQAASVAQSSASLEQMASNIRSLSSRAGSLGRAFEGLKTSSDDGRDKLYAMVAKIETIATQSGRLAEANDTIKAIAGQTNLLSMNAAIEAAHAGEAGAGFAVVAAEIRQLAEAATRRSRDISAEVKAIQTLIAQAAQDSETAKTAFAAVLTRVDELGAFEAELQNALAEQDQGAQQLLASTAEVSRVTTEVRRGSSEILEGSLAIRTEMENLLDHSRQLETTVDLVARSGAEVTAAAAGVLEDAARNRGLSNELDAIAGTFRV